MSLSEKINLGVFCFAVVFVIIFLIFAVVSSIITYKDIGYIVVDKKYTNNGYCIVVEHQDYTYLTGVRVLSTKYFYVSYDFYELYSIGDNVDLLGDSLILE